MNLVWAVAWRAPCAGLRCTETSTFSAPNASFASNIARIALGSRVQLPKQYSILSKPFRRKTYWARGLGTRTTRHGIASFTVRDWGRPQYRSTTATFSTENRPHDGLPDDFDRREGVRFRTEDLTEKEITSIFGPEIDIERGNRMLRVIHGQRLSGTLDELIMIPHPTAYSNDLMTTGLLWLRAHYPVDEDAAIMARIEKEERVHEERLMADAERLGIYKPQAGVDKNNVHGKSGLDAIREHYERQEVEEYKPQAGDIRSNTGELQPVDRKVELSARPRSDWLKYWADRAVIYAGKEAPTMSIWKRLWPSALVTSVVVGLSVLLAKNYVPPSRAARIWPDMPPAAATIITLASVNFAVLLLWKFPPAWRALNTYFLSVPGYPSALSVLGNV
ncbi:MAG: hypothetical protein M1830_002230, partial [Pleopsidium flavum]